ncbi:MAG: signal peptidase II [Bacteroidetes bacterium]|nr:signal peptidase II [Bacteroidota bacterium]
MRVKKILRTLVILIILSSTIGCDQISKSIVRQRIQYNERIGFINNHLTLTKIENTGAFLSLGHSMPTILRTIFLIILPSIILALAFIYLLTKNNLSHFKVAGLCFVVGGGVGNLFDRVVYGSVTDFLHLDFEVFQTGIFNMADVSIMVGVVTIIVESYLVPTNLTSDKIEIKE